MAGQGWYHLMWDATPDRIASVLEHGLERVESNYRGYFTSRADHTYVGNIGVLKHVFFGDREVFTGRAFVNDRDLADWAVFKVDVSALEAQRVNADEDHFAMYSKTGGLDVLRRFHLPFPPFHWAWEWAQYLGIHVPASLGEWADAIGLGSDPAETRHSVKCGSFAYQGVITPSALRLVRTNVEVAA